MQNRYAGDFGDYIKMALLRGLTSGRKLGVAWYLYPDEDHNNDGRHLGYLSDVARWRPLDPLLFDAMANVGRGKRSVAALQQTGCLPAVFADAPLDMDALPPDLRTSSRQAWFDRLLDQLKRCDIVFADPDNGLVDSNPERLRKKRFGKQMPLSEAHAFADNRVAVIYHHNSRFKGGHEAEVSHWLRQLPGQSIAVRSTAFSSRTFFIVNPRPADVELTTEFCRRWQSHGVRFHPPIASASSASTFKSVGAR